MKKILLLLVFAACSLKQGTQAQDLNFLPAWKANDVFTYYFFKNKYSPKDTSYKQDKDTVLATFKVLAASKKGHELELRYNYAKSLPPAYPPQGIAKIVLEVKHDSPIVLLLDSTGKYNGIKNWQELKKKCATYIDAQKKLAKAEEKGNWEYWAGKLGNKEGIEKYFAEDIEYFFMLYGSSFKRNSTFDYADEMKNPFSPDYLGATTTLEVKDYAEDKNLVEVNLFTLPDPAVAAAELQQLRNLVKSQLDNPEQYSDEELFELQDYYVYLHNTQTGAHQTAIYLRYLKEGPKELIESWKFIAVK